MRAGPSLSRSNWVKPIEELPYLLYYEGWFPPILTFKVCYAILLCCYSVFLGILICMFESYYSLSNFVIHFSDFIMPLCILLFSFEFCYSLSHYVMQLSNSIIRLYSPLMQFRIVLFLFQFCYSLFQFYYANTRAILWLLANINNYSVIQFPNLLFAFELCSSKSGTKISVRKSKHGPELVWHG